MSWVIYRDEPYRVYYTGTTSLGSGTSWDDDISRAARFPTQAQALAVVHAYRAEGRWHVEAYHVA